MSESKRLVEQRQRNQVMDVLMLLVRGDDGVRRVGRRAFYDLFFGSLGDSSPGEWRTWTVFSPAEVALLDDVYTMMVASRGETAVGDTGGLVESGWPWEISQAASPALHVMSARGRFSEDVDESEPSGAVVDLHDARHAPVADVEVEAGLAVDATVLCHHTFGMGVWVAGLDHFGHVDVPAIRDGAIGGSEDIPVIGSRVRAVVLGSSATKQLRLSTRRSDLPGLTERGVELLRQIAAEVGVQDLDVDDEHARWWLYWDVVPRADVRPVLREIVAEGEALGSHIVTEVLKYVDEVEGRTWVDLLRTEEGRAFPARRLREWALIREVTTSPRQIADDLPGLTMWCQRRLVEHATSDVVLSDLAAHASFKKVRHAAREKLRGRWTGWG
ncbi:hypothetical protein L1785_11990 [Antribacter sp. KLBMP9083]|uniref:Uncharacterized protein n=1 Tax=Antribacter soli TaxID=2910976 RepID=A0AA41QEK2_9MICO|nr:hypothetical protein [Antribacter soli]MCF4121703.1 hypothetical protein [Antribacter soli]